MIEEIKKELREGRKVKLEKRDADKFMVDESKFKRDLYLEEFNDDGEIVLTQTMKSGFRIDNSLYQMPFSELRHFKIKKSNPTFDDLIDVAVKAYKDGVIDNLEITKGVSSGAGVRINGNRQFTNSRPMEGINFINSLYTETFVIESEQDVLNAKDEAEILFANGEKGVFVDYTGDGHYGFILIANVIHRVPFPLLKGATVTQRKARNEISSYAKTQQ